MGGWMGGLALIQGLLKAKKTGKGFYIDYSVTEGAMSMMGTYMLDYQVNGRRRRRPDFPPGNRSIFPALAPHNTYRCAGKDRNGRLVGLHCVRDAAPVRVALSPSWAARSRSRSEVRDQRRARGSQDELDAIVGRWTRARRYDIMRRCQAAGIIAAWSRARRTASSTSPAQHREMHPIISDTGIGDVPYEGYPVKMSRTPAFVHGRAADAGRAQRLRLRRDAAQCARQRRRSPRCRERELQHLIVGSE
jgi:crotonobetainyl-CoA:carnitine CoA-transferase CaiB-like acyl-CoA transferase